MSFLRKSFDFVMDVEEMKKNVFIKRSEDPISWISSGLSSEEIAKIFYRKYDSYYKRLEENHTTTKRGRFNRIDGDLHRYILMFFGYAIENYLKAALIKKGLINPISQNPELQLSKEVLKHDLENYYKRLFGDGIVDYEKEVLENLKMAILSGKYPVPKFFKDYYSYTYKLEETVNVFKKIIKKIKQEFKKLELN